MKDINCELINTDVLTTDYKTITHPNGFIFKYQLQQLNQEEQQFVLSSIKYLKSEDNYLFFIDPNNLDALSQIPFNDDREVSKLVTPVKDFFNSEQDIIDFTDFESLYKGNYWAGRQYLSNCKGKIVSKVIHVSNFQPYDEYDKSNYRELNNFLNWIKNNSDKIKIHGDMSISKVPHYNQNDDYSLYHFDGLIEIIDPVIEEFFWVKNQYSYSTGMSKFYYYVKELIGTEITSSKSFANCAIRSKAMDVYNGQDIKDSGVQISDPSLLALVINSLNTKAISDKELYKKYLHSVDSINSSSYLFFSLALFELILNDGHYLED